MIRVFASITDTEPAETHEWSGSLRGWLCANIDGFDPAKVAPFAVTINGALLPREHWGREIGPDDVVDITVQPQGVGTLIAGVLVAAAVAVAINAIVPEIPKTGQQKQGEQQDLSAADANTARLGGTVPEVFGSYRRYPDYLVPSKKYFADGKLAQRMFLCVGVGEYDIPLADRKIGESQMTAIPGVTHAIYEPNESVASDPAAEWWHSCAEVGGTSTGNAGIPLIKGSDVDDTPDAQIFTFNNGEISIPAGAGEFPAGWDSTLTVRVEQYLDYEIESGGTRDIIRGALDQLGPFVGMKLEIRGDNAGYYEVHSYTASVPDDPGSASTLTGNAAPARYDFDVTPVTFTVTLDGNPQTVTFNTDLVDLTGLIAELNTQLDGSVDAQDNGAGRVELVEQGPNYSGGALTVSGTTTDVFGASPVAVTGDETTDSAPAEMTLSYDGGDPVFGFTPDAARMAIGYDGMLYKVDVATTSAIELTRLTDTGASDGSWSGFDNLTTSSATIYVVGTTAAIGWAGPFNACPVGETTDLLEYDIFFPRGLWETDDEARTWSETQTVELQWREAGTAGAWNSVTQKVTAKSKDQIGYTFQVSLPSAIRPEVRMRRLESGNTTWKYKEVEWYGLRAKLDPPTSYPWTTMSVEIERAEEISGQSENKINVLPNRKIPVLSGGSWTAGNVETRDIIPAVRYMAESVGMAYDNDTFVELDTLYKSRGDYFDYVFDETTSRDAIKTALAAGMAELTIEDGAIKPVRDGVRSSFEQAFSPQNMTGDGLTRAFSSVRPDDADGVDVEYTDRDTWAQETVECRLPGDLGNKVEKITLDGVTDRTQAWRIGMRYRRRLAYQRWEYKFNTELEGLNAGYKSYISVLDDVPGYGQSSIMRSIVDAGGGDAKITVTEDMDWSGTGHVVAFRNEYGELVGPYSAAIGNNDREIVADIPAVDWPDTTARQEPPHVYFGTAEKWTFPALVQSVEPSGGLEVGISAVNYDARVYADDDNTPPE